MRKVLHSVLIYYKLKFPCNQTCCKDNSVALRQIYKFALFLILISLPFVSLGCTASRPLKGVTPEGQKVYLESLPIENTKAYQAFLLSSKSETAKLYYLLDRIKAAKDVTYRFEGSQYNYFEAYLAALWLLIYHYKRGEDAHSFIRKEIAAYAGFSESTTMNFPDGSYHLAYHVLINELDLLEETFKQHIHSPRRG